jgi:hypothetical protein
MSKIVSNFLRASLLVLLMSTNSLCLLEVKSADYCGQPIPRDLAEEGYESKVEKPFADPMEGNSSSKEKDTGNSGSYSQPPLRGQAVYIPPGASIPVYLDRAVGSGFSKVGEVAYGRVDGSNFGLPSGSIAEMVVLMVEPAKRGFAKPGRIQIGANRIILPNGQSVWLRGLVTNQKGDSKLSAQTGSKRAWNSAGKIALGSGAGALAGLGVGAISKGNLGTATLAGAGIGLVAGGIWAALVKGEEITVPAGVPLMLNVSEGAQVMF